MKRLPPPGRRAAAAGWIAAVPVAGIAAARLARFDRHPLLSMANAGTPFVYLPAYGALALGVLSRRKALTAVSASVAAAHLVWTRAELRSRRRDVPDGPGTRLRVVSSNVRSHSPDSTPLGLELATLGADVLLLQELSAEHLIMLKATGAFDDFPYSYVDTRPGSFGAGIWSKHPLADAETWEPGGLPMARATVEVGGTPVRVFNVHARAAMRSRWIPVFKAQMRDLRDAVRACDGPVIMAGDFNATYGHQPFRDVLAAGLRDAHVDAGRGLIATTWPRGGRVIPPLFRIDHVLVSPQIGVLDACEGVGRSSDHRPVLADLVIPVAPSTTGATAGPASSPTGS
ncbi:MAG: endonuclease/exonuclease/phosphatase family protein [Acidimicrobiales bacterium]